MDPQVQTMLDNIKKNTGKPVEHWIKVVNSSGLEKHGEKVKFLKAEHSFTHGYANTIVLLAKDAKEGKSSEDDLVSAQYTGKESLKPFYDKLIAEIQGFGADVELAPKKAYVSIRRKKQFTLIQPSTKTRLDIGINIKDKEPEGKLEASGSWNSMVSHRVCIQEEGDINSDVISWLREAYETAG